MVQSHESELETQRMRYAFWLAVAGLGFSAALVIFLVIGDQGKPRAKPPAVVH